MRRKKNRHTPKTKETCRGKRIYLTARDAEQAMKSLLRHNHDARRDGELMHVYRCPEPGELHFHVGHYQPSMGDIWI